MKKNYPPEVAKTMLWHEHMRFRPTMYLGTLDNKGVVYAIRDACYMSIKEWAPKEVFFELEEGRLCTIRMRGFQKTIRDCWSQFKPNSNSLPSLEFLIINALSQEFKVSIHRENDERLDQIFRAGIMESGEALEEDFVCTDLEFAFDLDVGIWGDNFNWKTDFFKEEMQELAFLSSEVQIEVKHAVNGKPSNTIFFYPNGLADKIENEKTRGIGGNLFETQVIEELDGMHLEVAFAFRHFSVDQPFIKSYCNGTRTVEHGSHVDGLLKGLTYGVMKYFQKENLVDQYKISEKGMAENLIAAINVNLEIPEYSGCVKNKLANSEIIERIANLISEVLFKKTQEDKEATALLIRKFQMY